MAGLPQDQTIIVRWKRIERLTPKGLWDHWEPWMRSVYVVVDKKRRPLYIGKATGKKWPGFGDRYNGDLGALSAFAHGTKNRLYIGVIVGRRPRLSWFADLERELIAREAHATDGDYPMYNSNRKARKSGHRFRFTGDVPRFFHSE